MPEKSFPNNLVSPAFSENHTPFGALLCRIYWMLIGHVAIIFTSLAIASNKVPVLASIPYFFFVACLILVRFIDIRFCNGQTRDGDPATMKYWQRFALIVIGYGILL